MAARRRDFQGSLGLGLTFYFVEIGVKYVLLLNTVVNTPDELAGYIVTPEGVLFDCVPMPRMRLPSTETVPPRGTLGSCNSTPLLSTGRSETGFWTWLESGAVVAVHVEPLHV